MKGFFAAGGSALALVAAPPVAAQETASRPGAQADGAANASMGDIVVTASRRSDTIKNTPIAVTAIGGDALKSGQAANLSDLAASTPNVQISATYTNANIAIRGIGNAQVNAGADTGVAVHQDGVYIGQSGLTLSTLMDVQRVEILRGPQGLLFGRNATGGAINVIPNRPTDELHYGVDTAFGVDPTMLRSSAFISGPLSDSVRGRLSVQQNYNEGFTKNLVPNSARNPVPRRLDDVDSASVRAQLEVGQGDFNTRLSLEYQKDKGAGQSNWLSGTPTGVLPPVLAGASLGDVDKREIYNNYGLKDNEAKFATLISTLALGGGELKFTGSYGKTTLISLTDGDGTNVDHTSSLFQNRATQQYAELIYTSDASRPLSFVMGANFYHERLRQDVQVPISTLPPPLDVLGAVEVDLGGVVKTRSYAAFGQAQYRVSDALNLFAGLRYTRDRKSIDGYNNFGAPQVDHAAWGRATYEVGGSYKLNNNVSAYAKYGTGYKGGGYSAGAGAPAFNPETNTNIEVGLKGTYFGGLVQANLAAFRMKYKNLQVNQVVGALSQVTNAARATVKGVEAEVKLQPTDALHFDVNGAWLDATFDEFFTSDSARPTFLPDTKVINGVTVRGIQLAGNRLPQAPKFALSGGAYYDLPFYDGKITVGARYDWKSRVAFSEFNLPVSSQKPIGKLNLSLRYASDDGRWTASVFALNVTDEQVKQNVVVVSALIGSLGVTQYQPGRQIGVSLGYKY